MDILITNQSTSDHGLFFEATCGKKSAFVSFGKSSGTGLNVCCQNASHRVWRGSGKWFRDINEAKAAYKSSEMKAILDAAHRWFCEQVGIKAVAS